eukprot:scaffold83_cov286-Prasinococcus_capsulatus_cf.AAC.6
MVRRHPSARRRELIERKDCSLDAPQDTCRTPGVATLSKPARRRARHRADAVKSVGDRHVATLEPVLGVLRGLGVLEGHLARAIDRPHVDALLFQVTEVQEGLAQLCNRSATGDMQVDPVNASADYAGDDEDHHSRHVGGRIAPTIAAEGNDSLVGGN